jgi:hypothetical protein
MVKKNTNLPLTNQGDPGVTFFGRRFLGFVASLISWRPQLKPWVFEGVPHVKLLFNQFWEWDTTPIKW